MEELTRGNRYICGARVLLQNYFQQISCSAIDSVLRSLDYKFTDAFHVLNNISSQHVEVDGNGAGLFDGISPSISVFIKQNRPKKDIDLTTQDALLLNEMKKRLISTSQMCQMLIAFAATVSILTLRC